MCKLPNELDLDQAWRLGEGAFETLVEIARNCSTREILEFGSGVSTIRLALALPETRIVSVEHDPEFFAETTRLVQDHGLAGRVDLVMAPLRFRWLASRLFYTYDFDLDSRVFDVVLIDGPPGHLITGRQACLFACFEQVREGGYVVLDDFRQPREKRTLARWQAAFRDGFEFKVVPVDDTLLVMRKLRTMTAARPGTIERFQNAYDNLKSLVSRARRIGIRGARYAYSRIAPTGSRR